MKNLALCFVLTLFAILPCPAQTGPGGSNYPISGIYVLSAPSGACTGNTVEYVVVVGTEYSCQNGTWGQIGGGGGGGGTFAGLTPGINTSTTPFGIAPGSAVGGSTSNFSVNCPASDTNTAPCLLVGTGASSTQPVAQFQVQNVDAYKLIEISGPNQQHIFGSCATAPIQAGSDVARIVHCTQTHSGVVADRYFASYNLFTGTIVQAETAAPAGTGGTLFSGRAGVSADGSLGSGQEVFNVSDGGNGTLGVDNSVAGTLNLANGSAAAHTIFGSGATTTNTILGFATVPANGHLVTCTVSGTTCTLTDGGAPGGTGTVTSVGFTVNTTSPSGIFTVTGSPVTTSGTLNINLAGTSGGLPYFSSGTVLSSSGALTGIVRGGTPPTAAEISGDCTTSGSNAITCTKINSTAFAGTNGNLVSFGASNTPADSAVVAANVTTQTSNGAANQVCTYTGANKVCVPGTVANAALVNSAITIAGTSVSLGGSTSSLPSPGAIGGTTPAAITGTAITGTTYNTTTKCAAAGSAANPSVASCSAAPSGSFSCATNASTGTCTINTTAMTSSSAVLVQPDSSLGTLLSVTCNTTADTGLTAPRVSARSNGTSFTITLGTFATNPLCFNYWIVN